jgi:hypothetical protein
MARVDLLIDAPADLPPWGHGRLHAWWDRLPDALRAPLWPWSLAGLVILALLLGFHQVVRQAVRQGEVLRTTAASRAEAVWRCNTLSGSRVRASCLAQIDAPPHVPVEPGTSPPNTANVSLATLGR